MKIGIIGAGNMGGAIARGLAESNIIAPCDIIVCSPNNHKELDALKQYNQAITTSTDNRDAVCHTDAIVIAVKPWLVESVLTPLLPHIDFSKQMLLSIAAGIKLQQLCDFCKDFANAPTVMGILPNTAISVHESMTYISAINASPEQIDTVKSIFDTMGDTMVVEERLMSAGTALASCGIAYIMRYIRAATEGGVELGMRPAEAQKSVMQAMIGAVKLLAETGNNPETEIDKVTTPGGLTIKGLNSMEAHGFTTAVIEGLKASSL